jgi:cyanate lyase
MELRITDRIIEEAQKKRLKNKDLAVLFGVSAQFITECKTGRSQLTEKQILKFLIHNRDVDAYYIIHGERLKSSSQMISGDYNTQAEYNTKP